MNWDHCQRVRRGKRPLADKQIICHDVLETAEACSKAETDSYSSGRPSLWPGTPGGSEEPIAKHPVRAQAYSGVRRGERRSDNEGIHVKANWYKTSIHRMLLTRLSVATAVIAALIAIAAVFAVQRDIDEIAVERVIIAASQFHGIIIGQLDAPALGDHTKIQAALDRLGSSRPAQLGTGQFVFIRILDMDFNEVAKSADPSYPHIKAITKYVENPIDRPRLRTRGSWHHMSRINGVTVVRVTFPLANSANAVVAYGDAVFAVSKEALAEARWRVIRTTGAAVAIVLITTLLLYPVIIRLVRKLAELSRNLLHANLEMLKVLGSAIAKRDSDTDIHNYRVTLYSVHLARAIGLDEGKMRALIKGAFLHDVGKIGISDSILLKKGRLTEAEFEEMKKHVRHGQDIIKGSGWLNDAASIVAGHHEKYDGSGYDNKVPGPEIPILARIFTIADVFDALTSLRPYKEALGYEEAMEILRSGRGRHFDPDLLDVFSRIAKPLYDEYANRDDEKPRDDVRNMVSDYFKADMASFLK